MTNRIEMTAIITGNVETLDDLRDELRKLEALSNNEPGCVEFRFFVDNNEPGKFVLWEIFENADSLKQHMEKDYTKAFFEKGLIASTEVIKHQKL